MPDRYTPQGPPPERFTEEQFLRWANDIAIRGFYPPTLVKALRQAAETERERQMDGLKADLLISTYKSRAERAERVLTGMREWLEQGKYNLQAFDMDDSTVGNVLAELDRLEREP